MVYAAGGNDAYERIAHQIDKSYISHQKAYSTRDMHNSARAYLLKAPTINVHQAHQTPTSYTTLSRQREQESQERQHLMKTTFRHEDAYQNTRH